MGEGWTPAPFGGELDGPSRFSLVHRREDDFEYWDTRSAVRGPASGTGSPISSSAVSRSNVCSFLGDGTLRKYAMGERMGAPDRGRARRDAPGTAEAMEDGAFGIATALIYPPGQLRRTDDLVAVMTVVAEHHGVHINPHPLRG